MSDQQDYSPADRLLHRLALGGRAVAEASFDLDRRLHPVDATAVSDQRHVFVTGLARAGTTVLMRQLHATGAYRSLTYRDMPFVLAPNLWARFTRLSRRDKAAAERAHGDGILVDFDSPEALEEVFWRVMAGPAYIGRDRLSPMEADGEVLDAFRAYVALLLRETPGKRYLSKNNNTVLRLPSIARAFPQAAILVPFRDPLQHAASLRKQHRLFVDRHQGDAFARDYMTWLVHHEFGADHRPFVFGDAAPTGGPDDGLAYWLRLWCDTYDHVAATAPETAVFLSYETLCDQTETVWPALTAHLDLPPQAPPTDLRRSSQPVDADVPDALRQRAEQLYRDLRGRELTGRRLAAE